MNKTADSVKFIFAVLISITLITACGDKKETGTEESNTKKEETTKESTTTPTAANQLYFVEEYTKEGQEVGKSDKFFIGEKGGYITAMLRTAQPIGVGSADVRIERESLDGTEIVSTSPFDVSHDRNYFFFDKITFYKSGDYKVTVFKKDGTPIASGTVRIDYK